MGGRAAGANAADRQDFSRQGSPALLRPCRALLLAGAPAASARSTPQPAPPRGMQPLRPLACRVSDDCDLWAHPAHKYDPPYDVVLRGSEPPVLFMHCLVSRCGRCSFVALDFWGRTGSGGRAQRCRVCTSARGPATGAATGVAMQEVPVVRAAKQAGTGAVTRGACRQYF